MIHDFYKNFLPNDSRRLLMTCSLNEFLISYFDSFCVVFFGVQTSVFIQNYIDFSTTVSLYHYHSFWSDMEFFSCYWTLSTSVAAETSGPSAPNARILHSLDRTQLIHTSILLRFSQRLVIHDSRAEIQRFMIPTSFVTMIHDSWFRFHPRKLKTLQSRRILQGLIEQREIEFSCDISTGQYHSSSDLLRYHEFTEIYMK